ncbi:MAG: DNA repair protein RecO [Alphaproteobacteria bacterium]|nr:DNA repair protein RecO [Alphaproteobacteria bacterium]
MEWTDEGLVLSALPHGETSAIVTLLTAEHGRTAALVAGGQGHKQRPVLQTGNHVTVRWRARLPEHLGYFAVEPLSPTAAPWLGTPEILALIASAAAVTEASLPERQPMASLYDALLALFSQPDASLWAPTYIAWEIGLLKALGYGLDLSCCAVTGAQDGLSFISPRTGRAVTAAAAAPYIDKLLPLPSFLCGAANWDDGEILKGLALTGHFLQTHVFINPQSRRLVPIDGSLPFPRARLADFYRTRLEKAAEQEIGAVA